MKHFGMNTDFFAFKNKGNMDQITLFLHLQTVVLEIALNFN